MNSRKITFINQDGLQLSARLELPPNGKPSHYAIFAHCFTCNKNLGAVRNIARALAGRGIAVLRFDFAGLGESEGDFVDTTFSSNVTDILAAADYLRNNYEAPMLLIGHSLGGAASLMAGSMLKSIRCLVTIGSPCNPKHVTHLMKDAIDEIKSRGSATVHIGGRPFEVGKQFLDDVKDHSLQEILKRLNRALLILHSPQDRVVEIANARALYEAARHPKSFISLDGADHILSDKQDSLYAGEVIASWAKRYLPPVESKSLDSDLEVVASLEPDDVFTTSLRAGDHYLTADEPPSVGGNNYGPSPYELLSSALAACTAMTLRMYANRKKWDVGEILVHVSHDKVYADDCRECVDTEGRQDQQKIDQLVRQLEFRGDLTEAQTARLLEIANRCPVHKTLEQKSEIVTTMKP